MDCTNHEQASIEADLLMPSGDSQKGFLVVGHGTRRPAGVRQVLEVGDQLSRIVAPAAVKVGFLELAQPTIDEAVKQLAAQGVRNFVTLPLLLFSAGHAQKDIPEAVTQAARKYELRCVAQSAPLDDHPAILRLSADRFLEALSALGVNAASKSIALAMIGRGSNYSEAYQAMLRFTKFRCQLTPVAWCETGFITAQKPSVSEVLERLAGTECETLVVQPHLLFEGELIDELRAEVVRRQTGSNRQWIITGTLATDDRLAQTLAELASQAIRAVSNEVLAFSR